MSLPSPQPSQHFSKVRKHAGLLFVSGEVAHQSSGGAPEGVEAQTRLVLHHLAATLANEGSSLDKVLQATVHLRHPEDFAAFNQVYGECFAPPFPVRTTVAAEPLYPGALIEVTVVAAA